MKEVEGRRRGGGREEGEGGEGEGRRRKGGRGGEGKKRGEELREEGEGMEGEGRREGGEGEETEEGFCFFT